MKIIEYAKSHPWVTGSVVVGGGLAFIVLSGWFTGGSGSAGTVAVSNGPSDSQIAANTALQVAQINAGAAVAQTQSDLATAKIAADLYGQQALLDYQLGVKQLDTGAQVSLADIAASQHTYEVGASTSTQQTQIAAGVQNNAIDASVEQATIAANAQIALQQQLIDVLKASVTPAPTPTPAPAPGPTPATNYVAQGPQTYSVAEYLTRNPDLAEEAGQVVNAGMFPDVKSYLDWHSAVYASENPDRGYYA